MTDKNADLPQGPKKGRPDFRDMPKCQAMAKSTGEQCRNIAVKGKRVCYLHGGKSTGPKTDQGKLRSKYARLRHGDYSAQVKENRRKLKALDRYFKEIGWLSQ
ncbi:MAG TPA: HGGxSTG domain-containing protein [Syntrophorhabdus sp.]|nr:HGGxSTG domain-containing protein [Syntrophorhabdus sp.]